MRIPFVTIVGRPNTGKSTLFNKIIGKRVAIESELEGTTRDRIFYKVQAEEMDFFLVDTAGLECGKAKSSFELDVRLQAKIAIDEADLILLVVEGQEDLKTADLSLAKELRKIAPKKPVLLVSNKCDKPLEAGELASLYRLGLGEPIPVSAAHKLGVGALLKTIVETLKKRGFIVKNSPAYEQAIKQEEANLNIALVGKPNVGKSSLINALLKQNRLMVSEVPGTTRDAIDSLIKHQKKFYNFIDTAGLRRQSKREKGIETLSALRSMAAVERCDVALLVLDSSEKISDQDQQIASEVIQAGKGLILIANKWDLKREDEEPSKTEEKRQAIFIRRLQQKFGFAPFAPVIFTSAVTRKNLPAIFEQIDLVHAERHKRIQTGPLNHWVRQIISEHPPTAKRANPKLYYLTQTGTEPPEFVVFINQKKHFHFSYWRYLENRLREKFGFTGNPIRLTFREKPKRDRN